MSWYSPADTCFSSHFGPTVHGPAAPFGRGCEEAAGKTRGDDGTGRGGVGVPGNVSTRMRRRRYIHGKLRTWLLMVVVVMVGEGKGGESM